MSSHARGRLVRLELGEFGRDVVEVISELDRQRYAVRFVSGAELVIPKHHTTPLHPEEERHEWRQRDPHPPPEPRLDV